MRLVPLELDGAWKIELPRHDDSRGWFSRAFCSETFAAAGLQHRVEQTNLSWNARRGTLRGLHYQSAPFEEAKLILVVRGRLYDVAVDIRPDSPTYGRHVALTLDADQPTALYLDTGFAHGFVTLADDTLIHYTMFNRFEPAAARGIRWDDPELGIAWPLEPMIMSERDRAWPTLRERDDA